MSTKTKIIVLRMKQLIYTGILAAVIILLLFLFLAFYSSDRDDADSNTPESSKVSSDPLAVSASAVYIPGVYTTELLLNDQSIEIEVIVDQSSVTSLRLSQLNEAVTTLYPLLEPSFLQLRDQLYSTQSLDAVTYSPENKYTTLVLMEAVRNSLEKAAAPSSAGTISD